LSGKYKTGLRYRTAYTEMAGPGNPTMSGGNWIVSHGALLSSETIVSNQNAEIQFGGQARNINVAAGGSVTVSGAIDSVVLQGSSGVPANLVVAQGGVARNVSLGSGGSLFISRGGLAHVVGYVPGDSNGGIISAAPGAYVIYDDPELYYCYMLSGGIIKSGATSRLVNKTLSSGAEILVFSGGSVSNVNVMEGAGLYLYSGAVARAVSIFAGGSCLVHGGAYVSNVRCVESASLLYIYQNGITQEVHPPWGVYDYKCIAGAGAISAGLVDAPTGCVAYFNDDAVLTVSRLPANEVPDLTKVSALYINSGGVASTLDMPGNLTVHVYSGGLLSDTIMIRADDTVTIAYDNEPSLKLQNDLSSRLNSAQQVLASNGQDYSTPEGSAAKLTIDSAMAMLLSASVKTEDDSLYEDRRFTAVSIFSSGVVDNPLINAGSVTVLSGGTLLNGHGVIQGLVDVSGGGIVSAIQIQESGVLRVSGYVSGASLTTGAIGSMVAGVMEDVDIRGCVLEVSGGVVSNIRASRDAAISMQDGVVSKLTLDSSFIDISSGVVESAVVNDDAMLYAASGAVLTDVEVNSGGCVVLHPECETSGAGLYISSGAYFGGFYWGHQGTSVTGFPTSDVTVLPDVTVGSDVLIASSEAVIPVLSTIFPGSAHLKSGALAEEAYISDDGYLYLSSGASIGHLRFRNGFLGVVSNIQHSSSIQGIDSTLVSFDYTFTPSGGYIQVVSNAPVAVAGVVSITSGGTAVDVLGTSTVLPLGGVVDLQYGGSVLFQSGGTISLADHGDIAVSSGGIVTYASGVAVLPDSGAFLNINGMVTLSSEGSVYGSSAGSIVLYDINDFPVYSGGTAIWLVDSSDSVETWTSDTDLPILVGSVDTLTIQNYSSAVPPYLYVDSGGSIGYLELHAGSVYISGGAVSRVMENEGYFKVISGVEPEYVKHTQHYPVFSGRSATVHHNTYARSPVISAGGLLEVFSSGYASDVKVSRGGSLLIHSGAWIRNVQEKGGMVLISSYSDLSGVTFNTSPAKQLLIGFRRSCTIHSGTTFAAATISTYGTAFVYSGGVFTAEDEFANESGSVNGSHACIFVSGGTMEYTIVGGYGKAFITDGGRVNSCTVDTFGDLVAEGNCRLLNVTVHSSASMLVGSGVTATNNRLTGHEALLRVTSGGYLYNNRIANKAVLSIENGASARAQIVMSSGTMTMGSGGTANNTILNASTAKVLVSGGGIVDYVILNTSLTAGAIIVASGGTVTLGYNPWRASLYPEYSDSAVEFFTSNGGMISAAPGADIRFLSAGAWIGNQTSGVVAGEMHLRDLTSENALAVRNGLSAVAFSGGEIISADVLNNGIMTIYDGGSASVVSIASTGELHESSYASSRYAAGSSWWYSLVSGGSLVSVGNGVRTTSTAEAQVSSTWSAATVKPWIYDNSESGYGIQLQADGSTVVVSSGGSVFVSYGGSVLVYSAHTDHVYLSNGIVEQRVSTAASTPFGSSSVIRLRNVSYCSGGSVVLNSSYSSSVNITGTVSVNVDVTAVDKQGNSTVVQAGGTVSLPSGGSITFNGSGDRTLTFISSGAAIDYIYTKGINKRIYHPGASDVYVWYTYTDDEGIVHSYAVYAYTAYGTWISLLNSTTVYIKNGKDVLDDASEGAEPEFTTSWSCPTAVMLSNGTTFQDCVISGASVYSGIVIESGAVQSSGAVVTSNIDLSRTSAVVPPVGDVIAFSYVDSSSRTFSSGWYASLNADDFMHESAPYWGYVTYPGVRVSSSFAGFFGTAWNKYRPMYHHNGSHVVQSGVMYTGGSMLASGQMLCLDLSNLVVTSKLPVQSNGSETYDLVTYVPITSENGIMKLGSDIMAFFTDKPLEPETDYVSGVSIGMDGHAYFSGGIASDVMIYNGGSACVDECGTVLKATVNSGGTLYIGATGSVTLAFNPWAGTVVSHTDCSLSYLDPTLVYVGGPLGLVSSGEYMSGVTVWRDESMLVFPTGVAEDIVVNGIMDVSSGGTASVAFNPWPGTVVSSEGAVITDLERDHKLYIGGKEYGLESKTDYLEREYVVTDKHVVLIYSGGTLQEPTISVGGVGVLSGGSLLDPFISAYGRVGVYSGGILSSARLFSSGQLFVSSGGSASAVFMNGGTLRNDNGYVEISYNPWGSSIQINGSGAVTPDHRVMGTVIGEGDFYFPDDRMPCYYGCPEDGVVSRSYDALYVLNFKDADFNQPRSALIYSGGSLVRTVVAKSGLAVIDEDGIAISTTLKDYGTLVVSGGVADVMTVQSTGKYYVSAGGVVNSVMMYGSGNRDEWNDDASGTICSGGTADYVTVSGAKLFVRSGGTAKRVDNSTGAIMRVSSGGAADVFTVSSGALVYVSRGAVTTSGFLYSSGSMGVSSGGTALDLTWVPCVGELDSAIGASVTFASPLSGVYVGAWDMLSSHVYTLRNNSITVDSSAFVMLNGLMDNCSVCGGVVYFWSGGRGSRLTVTERGWRMVDDYGVQVDYSSESMSALAVYVHSGASLSNTRITGGAVMAYSGGSIVSTTIHGEGGVLILSSGCSGAYVTLDYGYLDIISGGYASNVHIWNSVYNSVGLATVFGNGSAETILVSGGTLVVRSGGTALDIIENGGYVDVRDGATAQFTSHLFSGSSMHMRGVTIHSGTTASNVIVTTGCSAYIYSGGIASDIVVSQDHVDGIIAAVVVYPHAVVSSATATGSNAHVIMSGGVFSGGTITSSAHLDIEQGDVQAVEVHNGAHMDQMGGSASSVVVGVSDGYGGTATIMGGTASIKEGGGCVEVSGGTVSFESHVFSGVALSSGAVTIHSGTTGIDIRDVRDYSNIELNYHVYSGGVLSSARVPLGLSVFIEPGARAYDLLESGGYVSVTTVSAGMFASHYIEDLTLYGGSKESSTHVATFHSGVSIGNLTLRTPMMSTYIYSGAVVGNMSACWADDWEMGFQYPTYTWVLPGASITGDVLVSGYFMEDWYWEEAGIAAELHISGASARFISATHSGQVYVHSGGSVINGLTNMSGAFHIYTGGFVGMLYNPFMPAGSSIMNDAELRSAGYFRSGGQVGYGEPYGVYHGSTPGLLIRHDNVFSGSAFYNGDGRFVGNVFGYEEGDLEPFRVVLSGYSMLVYSGGTAEDILVNAGAYMSVGSGGTATLNPNPWSNTLSNAQHISSGSEYDSVMVSVAPIVVHSNGTLTTLTDSTGIYYGGVKKRMYLDGTFVNYNYDEFICSETVTLSSGAAWDGVSAGMLKAFDGARPTFLNNHYVSFTSTDRDYVVHTSSIMYGCSSTFSSRIDYTTTNFYSSGNITYNGKMVRGPLLSRLSSGEEFNGYFEMSGNSMLVYEGGALNYFDTIGGFTYIYSGGSWAGGNLYGYQYTRDIIFNYADGTSGVSSKYYEDGHLYVSAGGRVSDIEVTFNGIMHVCSGGTATNIHVYNYGDFSTLPDTYMYVEPHGYVSGVSVGDCGLIRASATVNNLVISAKGSAFLCSGCVASGVEVRGSGLLVAYSGVTGSSITQRAGARFGGLIWNEDKTGITLTNGVYTIKAGVTLLAEVLTVSGNSIGSFTIGNPADVQVRGGGLVYDARIVNSGSMTVSNGGSASGIQLEAGFSCGMTVLAGGSTRDLTVFSNGFLILSSGCVASGIKESGGHVEELPGCTAVYTPVLLSNYEWHNRSREEEMDYESYMQSATLHSNTVLSGGTCGKCYLSVYGGSADNIDINDRGVTYVSGTGAKVTNAYVTDSANLVVSSHGSADTIELAYCGILTASGGRASKVKYYDHGVGPTAYGDCIAASGGVVCNISGAMIMYLSNGGLVSDFLFEVNSATYKAVVMIYSGGVLRNGSAVNLYVYSANNIPSSQIPELNSRAVDGELFRDGEEYMLHRMIRRDGIYSSSQNMVMRNGQACVLSNGVHVMIDPPGSNAYIPTVSVHGGIDSVHVSNGGTIDHVWLDAGNMVEVFSGGIASNVSTLHNTIISRAGATVHYAALRFDSMVFIDSDTDIFIHPNTVISSAFLGRSALVMMQGTVSNIYPLAGSSEIVNGFISVFAGGSLCNIYSGCRGCAYTISSGGYINGNLGGQANLHLNSGASGGTIVASGVQYQQDVVTLYVNGGINVMSCMPGAGSIGSTWYNYISMGGGSITTLHAYGRVSATGNGSITTVSVYAGGEFINGTGVHVGVVSGP